MTDSRILVDAFVPVDIILPAKAPDVTVDSQLEAEIEQIDRKTQQSTESLFETETTAVVPLGKDKFKEEEPLVIGFNGKEYQQVADALNVLIFQSKKGIKLRTSDVGFGFLIGNDVTGDNGRREQMLKVIHSTMKCTDDLDIPL
jgi:hypothetical protein